MLPLGERMFGCWCKCRNAVIEQIEDAASASRTAGALRAIGWTSVAVGVTALGLYVGRELRIRYKIRHRTPSDFFSHAGEPLDREFGAEYGMGI